jgi:hypothetical protein
VAWTQPLTNYNQTTIDLENIGSWWTALRPDEQADPSNIDALVQHTEQVLATELSGWTQRMQDALAIFAKDQEKEANDKGTEDAGRTEGGPSLLSRRAVMQRLPRHQRSFRAHASRDALCCTDQQPGEVSTPRRFM